MGQSCFARLAAYYPYSAPLFHIESGNRVSTLISIYPQRMEQKCNIPRITGNHESKLKTTSSSGGALSKCLGLLTSSRMRVRKLFSVCSSVAPRFSHGAYARSYTLEKKFNIVNTSLYGGMRCQRWAKYIYESHTLILSQIIGRIGRGRLRTVGCLGSEYFRGFCCE